MAADIRHPLFARCFDRMSRAMEKDVGPHRDDLLAGLSGRVVEVGPGNGINFPRYPSTVDEVIAFEPEPYLREKASSAARTAPVRVTVRPGTADRIDLEDASVDAAVCSLVLCSVADQAAVLGELRRVIKPGGQLRFLEHVRGANQRKATAQRIADATVWPLVAGGCHCGRDTLGAVEAAGFAVGQVKTIDLGPAWAITNPHVLGAAVR